MKTSVLTDSSPVWGGPPVQALAAPRPTGRSRGGTGGFRWHRRTRGQEIDSLVPAREDVGESGQALLRRCLPRGTSPDKPACLPSEVVSAVSVPLNKDVSHGVREGGRREGPNPDGCGAQEDYGPSGCLLQRILAHPGTTWWAGAGGMGACLPEAEFLHGASLEMKGVPGRPRRLHEQKSGPGTA